MDKSSYKLIYNKFLELRNFCMSIFFVKIREKLYTIWKYIKRPEKLVCDICDYDNHRFAPLISDKLHLRCLFKKYMKAKLNLSNPKTFSEKLQWLKLHERKPEYTIMADKAAVKQYISDKLGPDFIIPTIGIYDSVDEIPFEELPEKFVVKCSHDSGSVFICDKNKGFDVDYIKKELTSRLKNNFFWYSREWVYKNIKPRIIVEEFVPDENGNCPIDYKFYCFNGKMEIFIVVNNRFSNRSTNYYNKNLECLDFGKIHSLPNPSIELKIPQNFNEMVSIAESLSENIPFLRVDLYSVKNKIYFGELTFYPSGGIEPFTNDGDIVLGNLLDLNNK